MNWIVYSLGITGCALAGNKLYRHNLGTKDIILKDTKDRINSFHLERGWFEDRLLISNTTRVYECMRRHLLVPSQEYQEFRSMKKIQVQHVPFDQADELDLKLERACKEQVVQSSEDYLNFVRSQPDLRQVEIALQKIVDKF
jgi:hypothetical protein